MQKPTQHDKDAPGPRYTAVLAPDPETEGDAEPTTHAADNIEDLWKIIWPKMKKCKRGWLFLRENGKLLQLTSPIISFSVYRDGQDSGIRLTDPDVGLPEKANYFTIPTYQ